MFIKMRNNAIRVARELGYPHWVDSAIRKARTEGEISRILATAREDAMERDVKGLKYKFFPHPSGVVTYTTPCTCK